MPPEAVPELTVHEILFTAPVYPLVAAFVFVCGTLIGSFLNVAIYRVPLGLSVNKPKRSFCFRCGTPIAWYDNLPIISYLILGGRDRACGSRISPRYALVELLTGLLFLRIWLVYDAALPLGGFSPVSIWYFVFIACLIVGTFTDLDHWIIPVSIPRWGTAGALLAALAAGFFDHNSLIARAGPFPALADSTGTFLDRFVDVVMGPAYVSFNPTKISWWMPLANAVIGGVLAPFGIWGIGWIGKHVFRRDAMGFGDVELFAMIGATLGFVNSVLVLVAASFIGSFVGVGLMVANRMRNDRSPLALGQGQAEVLAAEKARLAEQRAAEQKRLAEEGAAEAEPPMDEATELEQAKAFANGVEMEFVDLDKAVITDEVAAQFPAELARQFCMVPVKVTAKKVKVAVEHPFRISLVHDARVALGKELDFVIAAPSQLKRHCERLYGKDEGGRLKAEETAIGAEVADKTTAKSPAWKRYHDIASLLPSPKATHHLPFIPWIACGVVVVMLLHDPLVGLLSNIFMPEF